MFLFAHHELQPERRDQRCKLRDPTKECSTSQHVAISLMLSVRVWKMTDKIRAGTDDGVGLTGHSYESTNQTDYTTQEPAKVFHHGPDSCSGLLDLFSIL